MVNLFKGQLIEEHYLIILKIVLNRKTFKNISTNIVEIKNNQVIKDKIDIVTKFDKSKILFM